MPLFMSNKVVSEICTSEIPYVDSDLFETDREGKMPPVKFAIAMPAGVAAVGRGDPGAAVKVAWRLVLPSKMEIVLSPWLTTARSGTVSEFTSPTAMATGDWPTVMGELVASVKAILELTS